ncbi:uncharacterized protein LOC135841665 isoform X2 [Planococcus citri]|uniref:uncharacterized protein LOC135841665 isoform X2 n=1 Tax=Planococcus citri TaxID=170843 RepID=UPI0031F8D007
MKQLSKRSVERLLKRELTVVLPRIKFPVSKRPNDLFKRKKSKRGRNSGSSDKENDNSRNVTVRSQPNLNLIQIEKALEIDHCDEGLIRWKLTENDRKLLLANINNGRVTTTYSRFDSFKTKRSEIVSSKIVSQSQSLNVSQLIEKEAEMNKTSTNPKPQHEKKHDNDNTDDESDNARGMEEEDNASSTLNSPENGIRDLKAIIESHSSHRCTDEINRKVNNVKTWRTPDGLFVRRDFVIRITQCCSNQLSKDDVTERTTSVVASTTRHENIKKNSKQERKNIAVEKKVGINTRTKMNGREKTCTRIVEVQTTEERRKKIKLHQPTRMVTRHRAAFGGDCEFVYLTNENGYIARNQTDQLNRNGKDVEPSSSESVCSNISENTQTTTLNSNKNKISKILQNIILYREQDTEPGKSQAKEELRKSTRRRKLLSYKEPDDLIEDDFFMTEKPVDRKNVKQQKNTSSAKNQGQLDLELPVKPGNQKPARSVKNDRIEAPKKVSNLPVKRLMKKSEALEKTEKFQEQKMNLRSVKVASAKTAVLKTPALPRCSSKTQGSDSVANTSKGTTVTKQSLKTRNDDSVANPNKATPCVTFSSETPETIPRPVNKDGNDAHSNFTPCILLDRLDATDISTYAITPLREDRGPLPSKSNEDYGIDDVDTDDSTDEEDNPKKVVPQWARSLENRPVVQFYFPRDLIRDWIRPPTRRFTVKSLFF